MEIEMITILVSLLACVIALVSAYYARESRDAAIKANEISIRNILRSDRITAYGLMKEFSKYCSTYRTLQCIGAVDGTGDLVQRIEELEWETEKLGPIEMPEAAKKVAELKNKGWQLQRVLDRLKDNNPQPLDRKFETIEENIDEIIIWFANEHKDLPKIFENYLINA